MDKYSSPDARTVTIRTLLLSLLARCAWLMSPTAAARVLGLCAFVIVIPQSRASPPAARVDVLARGVNIVHWFRFPPNNHAKALETGMSDAGIAGLRQAGFTFVRLCIGPEEVMEGNSIAPDKLKAIIKSVSGLQQAGLAVMVEPHPELMQHWNLQHNPGAQQKLLGFWADLAPALQPLPARLTFPELVNEPSFDDPLAWDQFQQKLLAIVRAALPADTVVLTGTNWSSIDGLLKVKTVNDPNVIYSFHSYEPQFLTALGAWDPAMKGRELARVLPFPIQDVASCKAQIATIVDPHTRAAGMYWCTTQQNAASVLKNLSRAASWGAQHHVSVALTEFGAVGTLNPPSRLAYLAAMRSAAEQLRMPWAIWGLDDQMGLGQSLPSFHDAEQLPYAVVKALGLKSASSVAGP